MVVAVAALSVSLAGTGVAATISVLDKREKKQVKKLARKKANKRITKRAPKLDVRSAQTATSAQTAEKANNVLSASVVQSCEVAEATQGGTSGNPAPGEPLINPSACHVNFPRDVTHCTYTATIGESADFGESSRGFLTVAGRADLPGTVYVRMTNVGDAAAFRPFHLQVVC
jgi:hypothetical protein